MTFPKNKNIPPNYNEADISALKKKSYDIYTNEAQCHDHQQVTRVNILSQINVLLHPDVHINSILTPTKKNYNYTLNMQTSSQVSSGHLN